MSKSSRGSASENNQPDEIGLDVHEFNDGVQVKVHVTPRASRTTIGGVQGGAIRVYLTAPPVEGAANDALVKVLADFFELKKRQVQIVSGHSGRTKLVRLEGVGLEAIMERLSRLTSDRHPSRGPG